MERVMSQLAFYFSKYDDLKVYLVIMTRSEKFYDLPKSVKVIEPAFNHKSYSRLIFTLKILFYVRKQLKRIKPDAILSFGGKYNAFVLISTMGLGLKVFISDRSRPSISYGHLLDFLNPLIYKKATGIVAQTKTAKDVLYKNTRHSNIKVIGNPISLIGKCHESKEKMILNVGRFIASKQQGLLVELFAKLEAPNWHLVFLGEGQRLEIVKEKAKKLGIADRVIFAGNQIQIVDYYQRAAIFAFTSISEGFPNALAEAMSAGCACISFDCEAGPADLIDHKHNGLLIPMIKHQLYMDQLQLLVQDAQLREKFGIAAMEKAEIFELSKIGKQYHDFMLSD